MTTNNSNNLFYPYTNITNPKSGDNICISWFIYERENPIAPYEQLIDRYETIEDKDEIKRMTTAVDEYFTAEEMDLLKDSLGKNPKTSSAEFSFNQIYIPLKTSQAPLTNIPRTGKCHFTPIINLPEFQVMGFYLENYHFPYCKKYAENLSIYKLYNNSGKDFIPTFPLEEQMRVE